MRVQTKNSNCPSPEVSVGKGLKKSRQHRFSASKAAFLVSLMMCSLCMAMVASAVEPQTFTLSGKVFDAEGAIAGSTSIKVDSSASIWSDAEGNDVFVGI